MVSYKWIYEHAERTCGHNMKAIVFATKMGGGHMSAANAVANALIQHGCASEVCDFLTLIGTRTSDIVGGAYINLVRRSPNAFGKLYRAGQFVSTPRLKSIVYLSLIHI